MEILVILRMNTSLKILQLYKFQLLTHTIARFRVAVHHLADGIEQRRKKCLKR